MIYLDPAEIENLRKVYNREHPNEPQIPATADVWKEIRKRLHKKCEAGTAQCILNSMLAKPDAPEEWSSNPEEWLSSLDIDRVEKQYSKVFARYYYVGSIPIDFDKKNETGKCLVSSLCSLDIKSLYNKGYTQIGIVFNTDVSTGPGQHWIALFCDIGPEFEHGRITYFDSYSKSPESEIQRLMRRWKDQWDATGIHKKPMKLTYNKTRHQYQDSECGMYCLYFHYCCLMGIPMEKRIPDEIVRSFRGVLFRVGKK